MKRTKTGAGAGAGAGAGELPAPLASQPSFDFEKEMALELVDSIPEAGETSTLGKLARNFSIGSLVRSFSWGRSTSESQPAGNASNKLR